MTEAGPPEDGPAQYPQQPPGIVFQVRGPLPAPRERPYNPARARERMRGLLAAGLVVLLTLVVAAAFVLVGIRRVSVSDMKGLLEGILPPVVALTGTAVGFYFGGRREL